MTDAQDPHAKVPIDVMLAAMADPARRVMVELLARRPCIPSELAQAAQLSKPATSRHLRVLRDAGLTDERLGIYDGRTRTIVLRHAALDAVRAWLDGVAAARAEQRAAVQALDEEEERLAFERALQLADADEDVVDDPSLHGVPRES